MFKTSNAYRNLLPSHILNMHEQCPECHQRFKLEIGFWYGTGYVSYGLTIIISALTFIGWLLSFGVSANDNRVFYWLLMNSILLIILQPWLMRISRVLYLYIFVKYDEHYETNKPHEFDY
ncbi:MAG: DUF983 domain-containing protein [Chitinophagaceae bacterium]